MKKAVHIINTSFNHEDIFKMSDTDTMSKPTFSLITCTLGRQDKLNRLLESLKQQTNKNFELILIDQNETGFLTEIIQNYTPFITIIHQHTPKGLSLGRNIGINLAQGSIIGFPDDDCYYNETTLETLENLFKNQNTTDIIAGRTLDRNNQQSVSPTLENSASISRQNYLQCGNSNTIFLRHSALKTLGGFDEKLGVGAKTIFQSGEESDLILRALHQKMSIFYTPTLIIRHDQIEQMAPNIYIDRAGKYGAGFGALLKKHFGFSKLLERITRSLMSACLCLLRGDLVESRYKLAWAKGMAKGYVNWSTKKMP